MNLSSKQKEIVETNKKKVVVIASAAAGKTRVLTERVRYLLEHGADPTKMVVITFTNAAAAEMRERLGEIAKDVHLSTIHSYANYLLCAHGLSTKKIIEEENFDEFFPLIKEHPEVIKPVEHLLVDEVQDTDNRQFEFLLDMVQPENFFFVGDPRQSIYQFRGAEPQNLIELTTSFGVTTYDLNENYRNGSRILSYAANFLRTLGYDYYDKSVSMSGWEGRVIETTYSLENIYQHIKENNNYGDWFVLTRTNKELETIQWFLERKGIPCDTFKRSALSSEQLNQKMKENTVKILTIHTAKGLENEHVIVVGAKFYNPEEKRVSYVAATRAKQTLIWMTAPAKKTSRSRRIVNWES